MLKSTVRLSMRDENGLGCSYGIVRKGEAAVLLILRDRECAVFDYAQFREQGASCGYLLLKHYPDDALAYADFLKLIGKMCKKSPDSKYFGPHKAEDNRMVVSAAGQEHMIGIEEHTAFEDRLLEFWEFLSASIHAFC